MAVNPWLFLKHKQQMLLWSSRSGIIAVRKHCPSGRSVHICLLNSFCDDDEDYDGVGGNDDYNDDDNINVNFYLFLFYW